MITITKQADLFSNDKITLIYEFPFRKEPIVMETISLNERKTIEVIYDLILSGFVTHFSLKRINELKGLFSTYKVKVSESKLKSLYTLEQYIINYQRQTSLDKKISYIIKWIIPESRLLCPNDSKRKFEFLQKMDFFEKQMIAFLNQVQNQDNQNASKTPETPLTKNPVL